MAWNNNWNDDRRSNGGGWGRGYNNNRGYDRDDRYDRGYDNRRDDRGYRGYDDAPRNNFKFSVGQKCYLKDYPDTVVSIIRRGREQYECRLPSLDTQWFYEHELEAVEMTDK